LFSQKATKIILPCATIYMYETLFSAFANMKPNLDLRSATEQGSPAPQARLIFSAPL